MWLLLFTNGQLQPKIHSVFLSHQQLLSQDIHSETLFVAEDLHL
jgi:hypothetical protein